MTDTKNHEGLAEPTLGGASAPAAPVAPPPVVAAPGVDAVGTVGGRPARDLHVDPTDHPADDEPHVDPVDRLADAAGPVADLIDMTRRVRFWRIVAGVAGAAAVALAAVVAIDRLPQPAASDTGRFLAVVSADGAVPAMVVDVDTAKGLVTVRSVRAERPAGQALELWAVPEGAVPVSLGLVDPSSPVQRFRPSRAGVLPTRGAFAISVEPPGGSASGAPSGPFLYRGPLIPLAD